METSAEGLMALVGHEGIVLTPYKDSVGVMTIGIGHTAAAGWPDPAKFNGELTISEAFSLFRSDVRKYEKEVARAVTVPLKQHEFDALVSFHYNTGAIGRASFVKKLNAGDRAGAIKGIMDWRKPPEIVPRRTAERNLFSKGEYPPPFATLYPATKAGNVQWGKGKRIDLREHLSQPKPSIPLKPETVVVVVPEGPEQPRKNGFIAWIIDLITAIFGRK